MFCTWLSYIFVLLGSTVISSDTDIQHKYITCNYDGVNKDVTTIGDRGVHRIERLAGRAGDDR